MVLSRVLQVTNIINVAISRHVLHENNNKIFFLQELNNTSNGVTIIFTPHITIVSQQWIDYVAASQQVQMIETWLLQLTRCKETSNKLYTRLTASHTSNGIISVSEIVGQILVS